MTCSDRRVQLGCVAVGKYRCRNDCRANGGGYQAIMRDFESGAWIAATEMRKDGNADGF